MGDIFEVTIHARLPTAFYKVTSHNISFEVKAHSVAILGLAKKAATNCNYWIGFGQGGKIWIKGPEGLKSSIGGNYSLSQNQFRRFWVAWDCGTLRVGQGREISYILSYSDNVTDLNYITFTTHDIRHPATWKFELPPASVINLGNNPPYKKVEGGELKWVNAEHVLPDDSVIGGFESECVYVIRAQHLGSLTPGKFVPSEGVGFISWGGNANVISEFEILCGYDCKWVATSEDKIPVDAFEAGYSEVNHEKLYVGRVKHMNCLIPGKVQPSHKVCYISYEDKELPFKQYEILTIPNNNPYAARSMMENIDSRLLRLSYPREFINENFNEEDQEDGDDNDDDEEDYISEED